MSLADLLEVGRLVLAIACCVAVMVIIEVTE